MTPYTPAQLDEIDARIAEARGWRRVAPTVEENGYWLNPNGQVRDC